jgi:hypothetical protein
MELQGSYCSALMYLVTFTQRCKFLAARKLDWVQCAMASDFQQAESFNAPPQDSWFGTLFLLTAHSLKYCVIGN